MGFKMYVHTYVCVCVCVWVWVCEHRPVSVQFLFLAADILQNIQRCELDHHRRRRRPRLLFAAVAAAAAAATTAAAITVEGIFQSSVSCLMQFPNPHSNFIYSQA